MKKLNESLKGNVGNYIAPFLWLHNEDDALILRELERIYESNIRSLCVESRVHNEFCKEAWWQDMRLIMDFCKRHDMKVWILDDKHCPSGLGNGYFASHPELCHCDITERHVDIAGPVKEGALYSDVILNPDEELLAVYACKHIKDSRVLSSEIYDLSENIKDGYVYFDLPEGQWCVIYLIKTRNGIANVWKSYCDKLNPEATKAYINEVHQKHYDNLGEYFGNTFMGFFSDESFFGNNSKNQGYVLSTAKEFMYYPWHESVREHFREVYGKEGFRNILSLWFDFEGLPYMDHRVEYMNFITDEYEKNYSGLIADWCHRHGVKYIGHIVEDNNLAYDTVMGAGHYFKALRPQDMAGVDVVLNQILPGLIGCDHAAPSKLHSADFFHYVLAKLGSSLAHITPHMKGRAMCEIFGAYGWAEGSTTMKYLADHMLVRGINYFVPHAFSPKPDDPDCPPNFYASGKNPQYKYFKHIIDHMSRCCHLLYGTKHINSCALLFDAESFWSKARFTKLENIARVLSEAQLDYDILPPDALSQMDEQGTLNGEHYGLILVGKTAYLRQEVRNALKNCPAKVILVSDEADTDFEHVALDDLCSYMDAQGYRDITCHAENKYLRFYHGLRGETHVMMFFNEDINRAVDTEIEVKAFGGGKYILYDAFENKVCYDEGKQLHIRLEPYQSCMVMFGEIDTEEIPKRSEIKTVSKEEIKPTFEIALDELNRGEFVFYKETACLKSITGRGEKPHFSGNMRYRTKLYLEESDGIILDLGDVGETAELYVNGKHAGTKLFPPYRFDITEFVKNGENDLEIYVANTLANHIHDPFSARMLLKPSGLMGPVTVEKYVKLK